MVLDERANGETDPDKRYEFAEKHPEIAEEFKSDSGSTLKDKIDAIELMAQRAEQNSALALAATKLQDQVLAGICAKLSPKVGRAKR